MTTKKGNKKKKGSSSKSTRTGSRGFGFLPDSSFQARLKSEGLAQESSQGKSYTDGSHVAVFCFRDSRHNLYLSYMDPVLNLPSAKQISFEEFAHMSGMDPKFALENQESLLAQVPQLPDIIANSIILLKDHIDTLYDKDDLGGAIDQFKKSLRNLETEISQSDDPSNISDVVKNLWADFEANALPEGSSEPGKASQKPKDAIADEIAREVNVKWADRNRPEYAEEPWKKTCITFINHWYGRWLSDGSLTRAHLRHDMPLYTAYTGHLRKRAKAGKEPDIKLPTEEHQFHDDPAEALAHQRELGRKRKAKQRQP